MRREKNEARTSSTSDLHSSPRDACHRQDAHAQRLLRGRHCDQSERSIMKHSLILAIASCGAFGLLALSPASATTIERNSQRVSYADLNLDHQAGAEVLLHRIRTAADAVCGDRFGRMSLRRHATIRACSRSAMNKAVSDVGSPVLAELFYDRYFDRRPSVTIAGL